MNDWIELGCEPHHTLDWSKALERARQSKKKILWKLELGLEGLYFPLEDELRFQALILALHEFSQKVWPEFQEKSIGICLYRGTVDFSEHFAWTERQKENFSAWLEEQPDSPSTRRLFCADSFAVYFQMLSHRLPDEAPIFLLFDARSIHPPSHALQILSKERFQYFEVALRGDDLPRDGYTWEGETLQLRQIAGAVGLVFPETNDLKALQAFDRLLAEKKGRVVFESFLTEEWEGLDQLIVVSENVSSQTARKLKGFCAAGGEVIYAH
ncbi:MAG: hypothetical protein KGJ02_03360 [Verrucomicrobiota bacterium]|nr:hypothetical protein [Verrucomicrobiota bacterium]